MIDHANELRRHARKIPHPQGETPGVMLRAADEMERLQRMIASPYSMTRDDVIRMAIEAGFYDGKEGLFWAGSEGLERFAALVAAAEREACREVLEDLIRTQAHLACNAREALSEASARIYNRGDQ